MDRLGVPGDDGRTDVSSAFDDAFADVFGEAPANRQPSAAEAAASAARNAVQAADAAMAGLTQLFGNKDRLGSGPSFDEQTWAKAKPLFEQAIAKFKAAGADIKAMLGALMRELRDVHQWTADMVQRARPYLERFAREWRPEETVKEPTEKPSTGKGLAPEEQAKEITAPPPDPQDQAPAAARPKEQETATQVSYEPASKVRSVGTLVPTNMRTAVADALKALTTEVGPIDAYVSGKLGYSEAELGSYFSAEQVDALGLGIRQIDQGKGFVIGDQTGVGKGRFVAGLIRYAMRQGLTPVFVTEKPNLYGDMVRDLTDIGMPEMAGKVLMTNSGLSLPLTNDADGPRLKTPTAAEHEKALQAAALNGGLPPAYSALFTTYSQMQQLKGQETARQRMLSAVAPKAFLILDEAHNAGGTVTKDGKGAEAEDGKVPRSVFFRRIVDQARSVAYSSATWAKRPDVLDLYGAKTDMREAVPNLSDLAAAISKGGVPMQQIVTAQLASVGQYTRRERSFAGVTYDMHEVETNREAYDKIAGVLAHIFTISDEHAKDAVKQIGNDIRDAAGAVGGDGAVGQAGATSTGFASIMHNLINQMLLASKANGTVDEALAALKAGEKPVIAVANTMGSFIQEFAEQVGAKPGDAIDLTFNQLLSRYLARTLRYTVRKPFMAKGEKAEVRHLTVDDLRPEGATLYRQTQQIIDALDLGDMPVSPIDYMRAQLGKAGYSIGEITGRTEAADYRADGKIYYRTRSAKETSTAGRMKAIAGFNDGSLDAIILNQSGATGLSLHASEKVKDQRKRRMLIAQAEANIDTHMQMLGRVHRTGQVVTPSYRQLVANVPAEQRPAAVLANKMASLSASTTANRKGGIGAENSPDFINKYGGQVIAGLLREDYDLDRKLGRPTGRGEEDEEGGRSEEADMEALARKVTGRIPLLPLAEQETLYAEIESRYRRLIQELDDAGENGLEAKTLDLDARTLSATPLTEGRGNNPFTSAAALERLDVKRTVIPPAPEKVVADIARHIASGEPSLEPMTPQDAASRIDELAATAGEEHVEAAIGSVDAALSDAIREAKTKIKDAAKRAAAEVRLNAQRNRIAAVVQEARPGTLIEVKVDGEMIPDQALVLSVRQTGKSGIAPSSWDVELLSSSGLRRRVGAQNLFTETNRPQSDPPEGMQVISATPKGNVADFLGQIANEAASAREERSMVTGNILAGYAEVKGEGQIVNYTDHTGATRQGILLPKKWSAETFQSRKAQTFGPDTAVTWLQQGGDKATPAEIHTTGNELRIARDDRGGFSVSAVASKAQGGPYYLDRAVRAAVGAFVKSGDRMRATAQGWQIPELLKAVSAVASRNGQQLISDHPAAKKFVADRKADSVTYRENSPPGWDSIDPGPEQTGPTPEQQQAIVAATQKIVGPNVGIDVHDGTLTITRPDGSKADIGGLALGRLIIIATGPKMAWNAAHEAVHALRNLGVLSPGEWKTLEAAAKREGWVDADASRAARYPDDKKLEEAIAEQFARWSTQPEAAPAGMLGRAWAKVRRWLDALRNALAGRGLRTAEGVFEGIASGKVGAREPGSRADPIRTGTETIEQGRQRVLDHLVNTGFLAKELAKPTGNLMASLAEHRDAPPPTLAARVRAKVEQAPVIGAAAMTLGTHLTDVAHSVQMMLSPMAHGGATDEARAMAKDFANSRRLVRWAGNRAMEQLAQRFTTDQMQRMWTAADKESVARQKGSTTIDGLNTLEPEERAEVKALQAHAATVFDRARAVGIHDKEEPLPSYVPRMVVDIALQDEGKTAHVVKDIRTLVLATMRLQEAVIGRQLINQIKATGQQSGSATVWVGAAGPPRALDGFTGIRVSTPQMRQRKHLETEQTEAAAQKIMGDDGFTWFTIPQSPAFWQTKFKARDENGNPVFERLPIYVRGDFEGPLRAVMRKPDGALYRGAMNLKGRMMTAIMYGVAHLGVISARAFPISPNLVGAFREGAVVRDDVTVMRRLIAAGLAPIGKKGGFQDASSIEAEHDPKPGRSWTSQILAFGPGMVSPAAGTAIKRAADAFGDLSHGWMWKKIGDLQAGIAVRMERELLGEGMAPADAARVASHFANRAAGSIPEEAMSQAAAKVANVVLFSRSYRLGNAGAIKDAFNGLPRDLRAQIARSGGEDVLKRVRGRAQRIAVAALLIDMGLYYAANSAVQSGLDVLSGRHTVQQEAQGYLDRLKREAQHLADNPASVLNPFGVLQSLTPMSEHEPGKQNRLLIGFEQDGTGIYLRNPLGKYGEDISDYFTQPLQVMKNMMSPYARAAYGLTGRDAGDKRVFDPYANSPGRVVRAVGDYIGYVFEGAGPSTAVKAGKRLVTGDSKRPAFDAAQIAGGGVGMSISHGYPGGPLRGELRAAKEEHDFDVGRALPGIRAKIDRGDQAGAVADLRKMGVPQGLMRYYLQQAVNPRASSDQVRKTLEYASPEQRERIMRQLRPGG